MTLAACCTGIMLVTLLLAAGPARAQDFEAIRAGRQLFLDHCAACHSLMSGQNDKGPSLRGISGAAAGARPGFAYSDAMKYSGKVWNQIQLNDFLKNPTRAIPGTKMTAGAIADPEERREIIAYLQSLH